MRTSLSARCTFFHLTGVSLFSYFASSASASCTTWIVRRSGSRSGNGSGAMVDYRTYVVDGCGWAGWVNIHVPQGQVGWQYSFEDLRPEMWARDASKVRLIWLYGAVRLLQTPTQPFAKFARNSPTQTLWFQTYPCHRDTNGGGCRCRTTPHLGKGNEKYRLNVTRLAISNRKP